MVDQADNQLRADARAAAKLFHRYPQLLQKHLKHALVRSANDWRSRMLFRFRAPLPEPGGQNSNTSLHSRTGRLRGSLRKAITGERLTDLKLTLSSRGVPYAATQELGGTIRPKTRKFLTVPRKAAMNPGGSLRKSAAAYFAEDAGKGNVFVIELSGGLYIVKRKPGKTAKAKEKFDILFALRKRVTIPGPRSTGSKSRLGFFDSWDEGRDDRREFFSRAIESALVEASARG